MMKKSILSLSAAVALSGLGFATGANAVVVASGDTVDIPSPPTNTNAARLDLHSAGTGHALITPYYTSQDGQGTFINIINTDSVNGKAVKVRFRGAGNSDDVLDFTLFLSPGDVWSGMVGAGVNADGSPGASTLLTNDNSCTIPPFNVSGDGQPFQLNRVSALADPAAQTREGYVETLNMADIDMSSDLGKAIKHKNNVPDCASLDLAALTSTTRANDTLTTGEAAVVAALRNPTGGLMGSWAIANLQTLGTFSGAQIAVIANDGTPAAPNGTIPTARANLVFFPQTDAPLWDGFNMVADVNAYTADPLLTNDGVDPSTSIINPLAFDLPDLSSPLTTIAWGSPTRQALDLSNTISKTEIMNEWMEVDSPVPYSTDWVISQPTRRYLAAVAYPSTRVLNMQLGEGVRNPYAGATVEGNQLCVNMNFSATNREEARIQTGGAWSPGDTAAKLCGEVAILAFGSTSPLSAQITRRDVSAFGTLPDGGAGWATLKTNTGTPIVGYAAVEFKTDALMNFSQTFPHKWK